MGELQNHAVEIIREVKKAVVGKDDVIEQIMIYLSLALTVISLIDYLIHNKSVLAGKM